MSETNELQKRMSTLSPEKRALLALRLRQRGEQFNTFPLSFAQERLWVIDRLGPGSSAYNIPIAMRMTGRLDVRALEGALTEVARRHEVLRTTYRTVDGEPMQAISPAAPVAVPVTDLCGLPGEEREARVMLLAEEEARMPFDLSAGPMFRAGLLRLGECDHVLLFTMHHIVSDMWSTNVLVREVAALYEAFVKGEPSPLPALPIQYADFAVWQRGRLKGEVLEKQLDYWRRQLAGVPPLLELPTDRPRPAVQTMRGDTHVAALPAGLSSRLRELSNREGVTLFVTMLAAFQILLSRYTGQKDVVVGTPIANRNRAETEGLIGFFVNTLVMRADLSGDPTFRELLARVRDVAYDAYAHQDLPFEKVVQELNPERSQSYAPLFQVSFAMQSQLPGEQQYELRGLTLSMMDTRSGTSKFDLVQKIVETKEGLVSYLHYSTDLFDGATAGRMSEHFRQLLTSITSDPERRVSELEILTEAERRQLLGEWNETRADYPSHLCMQQLFERQARLTPDAVAATCEGRSLTYRELNGRANHLAHLLVERGAGPEVVVGLLAGRGLDLLTAVLAVFKSGAAYLPLDPRSPARRLGQVLTQSAAPLVLATAEHRQLFDEALASIPEERRPEVLPFGHELDGLSDEDLPACNGPTSLAYVIYTSGSTGTPKGAMVEQRGMVNHLYAKIHDLSLGASDVVAQTASQCFDISVWQMLAALVVGGRVEVLRDAVAHDARRLPAESERAGVTILETVPSLLRAMLEEAESSGGLTSLRWMIPTGEALPPELCRRWLAAYPHVPLVNAYGPTECSDDVSHHVVREQPSATVSNIPVGRPIRNMRLYVVDENLRVVPVGLAGELCVGGVGVGRGYLGDAVRTAEVFVPDSFGAEPGARLYRTGDLARFLADGNVEFLGRIDHQVKVRGYRIELGEIEFALRQCEEVADAAVLALEDASGGRRLVAYVVASRGEARAEELQARLKERLPEYMTPSVFITLEEMPLTPNGKIDRKALPAPEHAGVELSRPFVAPRTPLEMWLAEKWAAALKLKVEQVGVEDSFFELGGDSIRAAIIVNRVQDALREVVHLVTILDTPTVAGFAGFLKRRYPAAVARLLGGPEAAHASAREAEPQGVVTEEKVERLRQLSAEARRRAAPLGGRSSARRPDAPVVFVLSPPRSGSTLLRVLLGGHTRLFAPPELELLGFRDMGQRRDALSGRDKFWLEGVVRAVMQLRGCSPEQAQSVVAGYEERGTSTTEFYADVQHWLGAGKTLVDKTPSYALEAEVLERAEAEFGTAARYIHLVRRPEAMIHSYAEAQLDQIFPRFEHGFGVRELAELVWVVSQQNILGFLEKVDAGRRHRVVFEELVKEPRRVMEEACAFLGVKFEEEMLEPYTSGSRRMTDGPKAESKMLGDVKFHRHSRIEAAAGERWREAGELKLGGETARLARLLGYEAAEGADDRSRESGALTPILPQPEGDARGEFPLSFAQERLWFLYQLEPESPFYNMSIPVRMSGDLNLPALAKTLREMVRRHAVLRTKFPAVNGRPVQVVSPPSELVWEVVDLSGLPEAEREAELRRRVAEDSQRPFDLEREHALRAGLVRLSASEHVALFTMHHIASDGWSMGVLVREVAALYEAFVKGEPSPLPALPIQYADFAVWQREWLRGEALERQLAYWRRQLAGAKATLQLPTSAARPSSRKFRGASHTFTLTAELAESLQLLGRGRNATLFMTLLAGLHALLYRYTGQTDISVGTDMAGRNRAEVEPLIGFFINLLVMRVSLSGGLGFAELVGRVREVCLGAYAHQDLPFEKLVEELQPERGVGHTPLFQVLFVYKNTPRTTLELPGLRLSAVGADNETSKFDLALFIGEDGDGITGTWRYNSDLFDAVTVEKMSGHYRTLLESAAAQPDARIEGLEMLTEAEKQAQLAERKTRAESNLKRFKSTKPKAVSLSRASLVKTSFLAEGPDAPLVVEPDVENFDLADWATSNRRFIERKLYEHGSLLFRNCGVKSVAGFEGFARTQCSGLFGEYGDLPREGHGGKVYGSTPYPSDRAILFHNESSHMHRWPMKIWFMCMQAPETGGETPVVDCRKVYRLLDPKIRERFAEKRLMYVRNYVEGLDVSWQNFFRTKDRAEVEAYCRAASVEFEWKNERDLRTRQVCDAVARHPRTGEETFFNQIQLHHVSCLEPAVRESLRSVFGEEDLPRNVYYGDGSVIEDSVVDTVREVYDRAAVNFPWQPGDVLMLDNMLTAHGRNPYTGARKVVVALGDMVYKEEVDRAPRESAAPAGT
jgi:amino acid adenylation domain-containing protein